MSNINIVGRRLEGKTTLAKHLAKKYAAKVIWDPRGMISGVVVSSPEDLEDCILEKEWQHGPIVYRPESGNVEDEFTNVCLVLFPHKPKFRWGGFSFIIDEAGELQNAQGIHEELVRIIKQHPTYPVAHSVQIIQTNHRLAEFNNSCKALLDELYIFQTTLPNDIRVLEEHTGIPGIGNIVRNLPKHHCVRYLYGRQDAGVAQYEVWSNPQIWYNRLNSFQPAPQFPAAVPGDSGRPTVAGASAYFSNEEEDF